MAEIVKGTQLAQPAGQSITLTKAVRRVTVFVRDPSGLVHAETYRKPRKSKKRSKTLRVPERLQREGARSLKAVLDTYLDRHGRSNKKRRDGWLRDYPNNVLRAQSKGVRKFRLGKVFGL
jgi:hypothetical protein